MTDWDDEYWNQILDSGIWKDVDARFLKNSAPMSCTDVPKPKIERRTYPTVDYVHTTASPQAMVTADGQIGMWVKLDRADYEHWAKHNHTDCVPIGYEDDIWTDADLAVYVQRHDVSLHHAGELFGQWMSKFEKLAVQLGWDTDS